MPTKTYETIDRPEAMSSSMEARSARSIVSRMDLRLCERVRGHGRARSRGEGVAGCTSAPGGPSLAIGRRDGQG
ncbi:hypothetical protein GCM10010349_07390 [Streptomyces flavofungini]|nr:hypothetical protein GCM10010349_07390 [Streptomyces flavofungini]